MSNPSPCFDEATRTSCSRRCAGCSAECPEWAAYVEQRNQEYAERAARAEATSDYFEVRVRPAVRISNQNKLYGRVRGSRW